eukprot:TRINITY_DN28292_c0_g1_i1.p2 TRINITY_DN28292_c0_g1~~TRINITY_DN28292_c0_g1_i1.p2  ORF type:complete len:306 (+),score=103.98 TRINITY_DN28292_c0_g1_i1:63-920(+)
MAAAGAPEAVLDRLAAEAGTSTALATAVTTLQQLGTNACRADPKFRTVKLANPAFTSRLGVFAAGRELVVLLGFEDRGDAFVLPETAQPDQRVLSAVERWWARRQSPAEAAASPAAAVSDGGGGSTVEWSCSSCGSLNQLSSQQCAVCQLGSRPEWAADATAAAAAADPSSQHRAELWQCMHCKKPIRDRPVSDGGESPWGGWSSATAWQGDLECRFECTACADTYWRMLCETCGLRWRQGDSAVHRADHLSSLEVHQPWGARAAGGPRAAPPPVSSANRRGPFG